MPIVNKPNLRQLDHKSERSAKSKPSKKAASRKQSSKKGNGTEYEYGYYDEEDENE